MGFAMLVGCGGWIGPMWGQFLSLSWYLTYPLLNNHFGSKWYHAAHQWQNGVNPTINWYRRLVSSSEGWWETNVAAYNIRFGCIFISQNQLLRMEMAAGRVKEQTTIYRMNTYHGYDIWEGFKVLIAMIGIAWAPQSTSIMEKWGTTRYIKIT